MIKRAVEVVLQIIGIVIGFISPVVVLTCLLFKYIYTGYKTKDVSQIGKGSTFEPFCKKIKGGVIGENTFFGKNLWLEEITSSNVSCFNPILQIGNNCSFGNDNHIASINKVIIGDGVLTGQFVLIEDHMHGNSINEDLKVRPSIRQLYSKGPIIIGNNVWIGDGVVILSDVSIGDGCIIGANSVVTHSIPAGCVAAGVPARVIKTKLC